MAQVIASGRGKILVHQGFQYQKNRQRRLAMYWRCTKLDCRTGLTSNVFYLNDRNAVIVVNNVGVHTHLPVDEQIQAKVSVNEMKRRIDDDPTIPVRRVYDEAVAARHRALRHQAVPLAGVPETPNFERVRSSLTRKRAANMPPIPQTIQDVDIQGQWAVTWKNERNLLHLDNQRGIVIFSTDEDLRRFEERIVNLRRQFNNGGKTLDEYWRALRHTIAEFE